MVKLSLGMTILVTNSTHLKLKLLIPDLGFKSRGRPLMHSHGAEVPFDVFVSFGIIDLSAHAFLMLGLTAARLRPNYLCSNGIAGNLLLHTIHH